DVEIPVEAVALVKAADLEEDLAPRGCAVALHRIRLAVRDLVEVFEVGRAEAPRTGQPHGAIGERALERAEQIARQLHRAIELEDELPTGHAEKRVARGTLPELAVREEGVDAIVLRREAREALLRRGAGTGVQDEHLAVTRQEPQHAGETAREIGGIVARDDGDRPRSRLRRVAIVGEVFARRDGPAASGGNSPVGTRHERAIRGLILDAVTVEGAAEPIGALVVARRAGREMLLERCHDLARRHGVLARDRRQIETEDLVSREKDVEASSI